MAVASVLKVFSDKKSIMDVLNIYFFLGKLMGFTIYSLLGHDMQTLRLHFGVDDGIIYVGYLLGNAALLYFGRLEPKDFSLIFTFGSEMVLVCALITGVVSSTIMILGRRKMLTILQLIHQFDTQIAPLGGRLNYNREFAVFGGIVVSTCTTVFGFIFLILVYEPKTTFVSVTSFVLSNVNFTVLMGFLFVCLLGVRSRLRTLIFCFENHFGEESRKRLQLLSTPSSALKGTRPPMTSATGKELTINRFAILYNITCDMVDLINRLFGFQAMLFIGICFTYSIFAIFASFRLWYTLNENFYYTILKQLLWTLYYYIFVIAIIGISNSVTNTGKSCSILAYKAINFIHDPFCVDKLRVFAQQVSNRVPVVSCGLFTIDWTLFYAMMGASTTYLVILIQFDTSVSTATLAERLGNLSRTAYHNNRID